VPASSKRVLSTLLVVLAILLVLMRAAVWLHHGPRVHSATPQRVISY